MKKIALSGLALVLLTLLAYVTTILVYGLPLGASEEVGNHGSWRNTWYREYYFHSLSLNVIGLVLSSIALYKHKTIGAWSLSLGVSMVLVHALAFLAIFD